MNSEVSKKEEKTELGEQDKKSDTRSRSRSLFFAVTFFIIFGVSLLTFITQRQAREAESDRLQLLAGFSTRVESTLEDLARRFVKPVAAREVETNGGGQQEKSAVEEYLGPVPPFRLLEAPLPSPTPSKEIYPVHVEVGGSSAFFTYRAKPGKTFYEKNTTIKCQQESEGETSLCNYSVEVDLDSVFESIRPPEGFDALYLSTKDGEVLFSHGEQALRVTNLLPLHENSDGVTHFLGRQELTEEQSSMTDSLPTTVTISGTVLGGEGYRAFFQPISIELPKLVGEPLPPAKILVACGVVAEDSLLSSAYASSPVLLFVLVAIFPLALLSWPFAKLVLITKRQRFTRFDVGALAFAAVFGLAIMSLLVFGAGFVMRIHNSVEDQLRALSRAIEDGFRGEVEDIYNQLNRLDRPENVWSELRKDPETYMTFNAIFWIDGQGEQQRKERLLSRSDLLINVDDRLYFQCANQQDIDVKALAFKAGRKDSESNGSGVDSLCIESIMSKISGEDETVVAQESADQRFAVVGMGTRLNSLALPLLARGFGFAIVEEAGKVLFHREPSRNTVEDFLKANNEDRLLESLLKERRTGFVETRYWGESHLLYVKPLDGFPWTLITFWSTRDLRLRAFALANDFLNPFLLYLVIVVVLIVIAVFFLSRDLLENLWPHSHFAPVYRHIVHVVILLTSLGAAIFTYGEISTIYLYSTFIPVATLVYYLLRVELKERRYEANPKWKDPDAEQRSLRSDWLYLPSAVLILISLWETGWLPETLGPPTLVTLGIILIGLTVSMIWRTTMVARRPNGGAEVQETDSAASEEGDKTAAKKDVLRIPRCPEAMVLFTIAFVVAILINIELTIGFLIGVVAVSVIIFEAYQHRFFFRQRRFAFLCCWTGLLFVVGVLPAIGFVTLASSRQSQLLVMDTQLELAEAKELREKLVSTRNEKIEMRLKKKSSAYDGGNVVYYGEALKEKERLYLDCFFPISKKAVVHPIFTWPQAADEEKGLSGFIARLLATRLVGVNELTQRPTSADLSRFELGYGSWQAYSSYLKGNVPRTWGLGPNIELKMSYPRRLTVDDFLTLAGAFYLFSIFIFGSTPAVIANFIARRVLLISLVKSGDAENGTWTIDGILKRALDGEASRILLVTRVPSLAAHRISDTQDSLTKATVITYKDIIDKTLPREDEIALVKNFNPSLEANAKGEKELELFSQFLDSHKKPVIVLSQSDPREIFDGPSMNERENWEVKILVQDWVAILASFEVRYGINSGQPISEYKKEIQKLVDESMYPEVGKQKLAGLIAEECGPTRRLQDIGKQMIRDLHPQSYTQEEIISRIAVLARSYYQSIWNGCSVDEKLVLVRLAEDGLVSSQNFDHLLELLQKGLVRRDPGLRLINRSFRQFVLRSVTRADVQEWEEAGGIGAWSVLKWLLPLPLLLFGGFLFVTQRESFSNVMGLLVALGSVTPILVNLFSFFQQATRRTQPLRVLASGR